MKQVTTCTLLLLAGNLALSTLSAQVSITPALGNGADTFLSNDSNAGPSVVHGASAGLNLRGLDGARARTILIRFDVGDYTPESLTNATLALDFTASNRGRTWTVYGLADASLADWDEATTSYSNAPGLLAADPGNTSIDPEAWTNLGGFAVVGGTGVQTTSTVSLNLDNYLTENTTGLVSFLFYFASTDSNPDWSVSSKEGAGTAPTLNLPDAQIIPEPSTYTMIFGALALVGAIVRRRLRKN